MTALAKKIKYQAESREDIKAQIRALEEREAEIEEEEAKIDQRDMLDLESIEWPKMKLVTTGRGDNAVTTPKVYSHRENVKELLNHYGYTARYNEMTKDIEFNLGEDEVRNKFHNDTQTNDKFVVIQDAANAHSLPGGKEGLDGHLNAIASQNYYHPVREWIESKPWDGKSRIEQFHATITSDTPMKELILRLWMIQCIAALYEPSGVSAENLLVLIGAQGKGKTRWFRSLIPNQDWAADGVILNIKDKDSVLKAISKWIVELGELAATFRKVDIDQFKGFVSSQKDEIRRSYGRYANKYERRTSFFGSVDTKYFLTDKAGSRRFWSINVDKIDYQHSINTQQLWAEYLELFKSGERYHMTPEEQYKLANYNEEEFTSGDPIHEILERHLATNYQNYRNVSDGQWMNATTILRECERHNVTKQDINTAATWLKSHEPWGKNGKLSGMYYRPYSKEYRVILQNISERR